ncbi:DEAD/DEAH box helicase domain-containing protein [Natronoarchaeum philippinense]|uniref:DEAD/DEAH box helicase domain-containing protein n=1 Tax=Natronoarchaeum philippinense TaxID=558529 RepID=A0A285N616_NATPI|nr:DEAD/DEAH box helicase [Natronoarchaeum philippinense]SNZ04892.1 DEAD/DEAH box helicase domain-containing protein [Natronoarchaeum philippinense]
MDETIEWLRGRPYYDGQIAARRTVPGGDADLAELDVEDRLAGALADRGIESAYAHQAEAIERIRDGDNAVLATPTASGKSLAYTVPAFERALDRRATTLYIAPQVALINDQAETLADLAGDLGFASGVTVDRYTGRLSKTEKERVRDRQPTVLLTTPDMLHYGILPHGHRLWDWFFQRLETVVIDEVHEYRGVFGSQVALVLRRLSRLCERFDASGEPRSSARRTKSAGAPQFVCCSATIDNPAEHAGTVTGQPADSFAVVDEDASASGPTNWLLWNPPEYERDDQGSGRRRSNHVEAKRLFVDLVSRGYQTVVFTRARQTAEQYASDSADELRERGFADEAAGVTAYQAALRRERRDEIETGLHDGDIRGVWSTNALELGVDIGGLDAVILDGYPGTKMATWQQAGRAGRGTDPSLVALVAGEDQLDQYVMRNPDELFAGDPERAVANPENDQLVPPHVLAAARENWLSADDERHFGAQFPDVVADLESVGDLERRTTDKGVRWTADIDGSPQHEMSLRSIDDREIQLLDARSGDAIASLPFGDALRDAHPGAIYHHQGQRYEVTELDLDRDLAELSPTWADYHTRVLHDKTITVERDLDERRLPDREDVTVKFAEVTMRKQITGFERRDPKRGEPIARETLDLPETTLRTRALYFTQPDEMQADLRARASDGESFEGAIHAAEHALISLFPLEVLCDRRDIGGLSTPRHPHTGESTIFVYDGYPGGVGLTREGYERLPEMLDRTRDLLAECSCENGCPSCVQSPHCGNANEPLSKGLAHELVDQLLDP